MLSPSPVPKPGPPRHLERFLDVQLPDAFVVESLTQSGAWIDHNGYLAEDCKRLDDGTCRTAASLDRGRWDLRVRKARGTEFGTTSTFSGHS